MPQRLQAIIDTWLDYHNEWQCKIWTDKDLEAFPLHNGELYESTDNYGQKSDIARLEILYHLGGVYADTDVECLRPVDVLHYLFDFYIGIQPLDSGFLHGTSVIGSIPKHPMIKQMILQMSNNAEKNKTSIPAKTGPIFVTRIFYTFAGNLGCVILRCQQPILIHSMRTRLKLIENFGCHKEHLPYIIGQKPDAGCLSQARI